MKLPFIGLHIIAASLPSGRRAASRHRPWRAPLGRVKQAVCAAALTARAAGACVAGRRRVTATEAMQRVTSGILCAIVCCLTLASTSLAADATHLRLIDSLDRPADGYCIDVPGTPGYLRTDLPLFAHNCKPTLSSDSAVVYQSGLIRFVELQLCVTVAGINSQALPGTAVLLRRCGENSPFMETARLQRFVLTDDGALELADSGLCLAVGPASAATYSAADRWRPLYVDDCLRVAPARSRWAFVVPNR